MTNYNLRRTSREARIRARRETTHAPQALQAVTLGAELREHLTCWTCRRGTGNSPQRGGFLHRRVSLAAAGRKGCRICRSEKLQEARRPGRGVRLVPFYLLSIWSWLWDGVPLSQGRTWPNWTSSP
jgi:hypothetical protein